MKVIDGFIQDSQTIEAILKDGVWETLPQDTRWYSGWWKQEAVNVWEVLIKKIWYAFPAIEDVKGFEYWGNKIGDGEARDLGVHKDKDEPVYELTGEIISPNIGAVYYPYPSSFEGGYLEIYNDDDIDQMERIAPVFNRLVIFDPSNYHRVSKVYNGYRKAFVVNVWTDHTPTVGMMYEEEKSLPKGNSSGV